MGRGTLEAEAGSQGLEIHRIVDRRCGLEAVIALDSPLLGPAVGGCRMWPYASLAEAEAEACALARAMTRKVLLADLPFGGGKAVIRGDPATAKTPALWAAFAAALERLAGRYWTGEDSGTTPADMDAIARRSRFVLGRSSGAGDLGPMTAEGVLVGLKVALRHRFGSEDLQGVRIAVQGLGAVGLPLAERLAAAGAQLFVADLDANRVARAVERTGARPVAPHAVVEAPVDVLAPCALGGVIGPAEVGLLRCALVAGAANNPLATPETARLLHRRGILFAPDYVINAGGVIAATAELDPGGYRPQRVHARLAIIAHRLDSILAEAAARDRPPLEVTEALAAGLRARRLAAATGGRAASRARCPGGPAGASLLGTGQLARDP